MLQVAYCGSGGSCPFHQSRSRLIRYIIFEDFDCIKMHYILMNSISLKELHTQKLFCTILLSRGNEQVIEIED